MSIDDFYLYMVGHMAKHFKFGGIGIRMLLDFMIFENRLEKDCNRSYIEFNLDFSFILFRHGKTISNNILTLFLMILLVVFPSFNISLFRLF